MATDGLNKLISRKTVVAVLAIYQISEITLSASSNLNPQDRFWFAALIALVAAVSVFTQAAIDFSQISKKSVEPKDPPPV